MTRYVTIVGTQVFGSPEREKRELRFADDERKRKDLERQGLLPKNGDDGSRKIEEIAASMRLRSQVAVPQLSLGMEKAILENGPLLATLAMESNADLERKMIGLAERRGTLLQSQTPNTPETWTATDRQDLVRELLGAPETTLDLAQAVQKKIERYDEHVHLVEDRMKRVFQIPQGTLPIERFAQAVEGMTVDRALVEEKLGLTPLPPDAPRAQRKDREQLVHMVIEALDEHYKRKTYELRGRPEQEEEGPWHTRYYGILTESLDTLQEHLRGQLVTKAEDAALQLDKEWEGFVETLGLSENERTGEEMGKEAERRAREKYGTSGITILDEFARRAVEIDDIRNLPAVTETEEFLGITVPSALQKFRLWEKEQAVPPRKKQHSAETTAEHPAETPELTWAHRTGSKIDALLSLQGREREDLERFAVQFLGEDGMEDLQAIRGLLRPYADTKGEKDALIRLRDSHAEHWKVERLYLERGHLVTTLLTTLEQRDQTLASSMEEERRASMESQQKAPYTGEQVAEIQRGMRRRLEAVIPELLSAVKDHPISDALNLPELLACKKTETESHLLGAASGAEGNPREYIRRAERELVRLEQAKQMLREVSEEKMVEASGFPAEWGNGYYDRSHGTVYVRKGIMETERKHVWRHESAHAIVDILTRRAQVFPFLLADAYGKLEQSAARKQKSFTELLERLAQHYGIAQQEETIRTAAGRSFPNDERAAARYAKKLRQDALMDELLTRYALWAQDRHPLGAKALEEERIEREAFQMIESELEPGTLPTPMNIEGGLELKMFQGASGVGVDEVDGEEVEQTDIEQTFESARDSEPPNLKQMLVDIERMLQVIGSFINAYGTNPDFADIVPILQQRHREFRELYEQARITLLGKNPAIPEPEKDERFIRALHAFKDEVDSVIKQVKAADSEMLEKSSMASPKKHAGFWGRIRFMSLLDLHKFWKDSVEDVKTIWGRNQQRLLQDFGNLVHEATYHMKGIPIVGPRYLERLKGYHIRRYSGAEVESVGKWKDALKNEDSHRLLDILGSTQNKDQAKGIFELLTERGEMNWDDENAWRTLMKFSGYEMLKEACSRDDILRDVWLRRMISKIWNDKELYYNWRNANDSNTESHKKKYIPIVDQFSNVQNGLAGNLEKQLKLYILWKADPKHPPFPEDVKPHLYEQLLEYCIKNGKMSMEQKMYYLVQGVSEGILSIERLRALAGQHGGIINTFPFIDYFYQKNNTLPEIGRIAKKLREKGTSDNPDAPYKPGIKTTLWLHFEVSREESVRARLSKGSARSAEGIDHEDIPFLVTQMDYKEMSNMAKVISGERQKVTPEGWKNAYVGFNSKFKIFGMLARMEQEGKGNDRFTGADARMLAQNLGAYIFMDNILTLNGSPERGSPPSLSEYQFTTPSPSGIGGTVTRDYRNKMIEFLQALDNAGLMDKIDWNKVKVQKNAMLSLETGKFKRNEQEVVEKVCKENTFIVFVRQLERVILENPEIFKQVLAAQSDNFLNEGGSEKLTYKKVLEVSSEREMARDVGIPNTPLPEPVPGSQATH
ncbi:MAG: hypothetical protein WCV62_05295 [Candidatus Peribacteraceae bacterium]